MVCASCGAMNAASRRFCLECGTPLALACPSCGEPNEANARFCGACGEPMPEPSDHARMPDAGPPGPAPRTAIAERRIVSVLFADLVGFTTFAEGRDAEEVRETLSRYFELASDVIGRYGGTVEKFIGDAVMAVWGAPIAHEDDAERAVRAALELVDAVGSLGAAITARGAVLTGEAAVTVGALNQGMVAGDLVNTASRLQSVAPSGAVLVGESTRRAASRAIAFEAAGEQMLKGKATPVPAFRAVRVVAERGGRNRADALEAPFTGRDDELRLLKDLYHATGREHRARLVSVTGPAGIGKSRLAWEFLKYVDGLVEGVWWHDGRSPAYGDGISFWALGEMIRARAGLREGDDEATTRAGVAKMLATHLPDEAERRWIEPAMLALLGIEAGVPSEQLYGAWRTFFERLAESGPVVLVFEDLHHADTGLLDFVDSLVEWSRTSPIYVLTLARPELFERRADWGAAKRSFTSLHLEALSEASMRQLLAGLVPGLPEAAVRPIVARADGIPLYAVETVRMLLADKRLVERDGVHVPVGDLTELAVPETLAALIASRLDALDASDRSLVADAAVLGQSFTVGAIAAVATAPELEVEVRLRSLVRREVLTLASDPRSPERGQYAFVQALIREVAYQTLSREDRKTRHLAAARFLEGVGSDELAGALASHYLAAQANAREGAERDALAGQARIALQGAAQRAAALGSHDQAAGYLGQALSTTSDPALEAELLSRLGDAADHAGRYELAETSLRRAADLARDTGDRTRAAAAIAALGKAMIGARRTHEALAVLEPAAVEFADLASDPAVAALRSQLARGHYFIGKARVTIEESEPVLEIAEREDLTDLLADTLVTKGMALASVGRTREGLGVIRTGAEIARASAHRATLLRALRNESVFGTFELEATASMKGNQELLELARRFGDRNTVVDTLQTLGWMDALFVIDPDRAMTAWMDLLSEGLEPADEVPILNAVLTLRALRGEPSPDLLARLDDLAAGLSEPGFRGTPLEVRGWISAAAGRLDEARHHWEERIDENPEHDTFLPMMCGRIALWDGDIDHLSRWAGIVAGMGIRLPASDLRRRSLEAGLAGLRGEAGEAAVGYRHVLDGWRQLGHAYEEGFTAIDMVSVLDPELDEVRRAAERGIEVFERMGATPFLARLEASMARRTPSRSAPSAAPATPVA
jgi:class 3 adenylate cyclase/tetratricopeptide (TPR) repeat protein